MHITDEFLKVRMIETACVKNADYEIAKELLKTRRQLRSNRTQKITACAVATVLMFLFAILLVYTLKCHAGVC